VLENIDLQQLLQKSADLISTWGLRVVGAIALLVAGWIAARLVQRGMRSALTRAKVDPTLTVFGARTVYYLVVIFIGLAVLSLFGIQTASFIAVLGAAGLAVGLAMQGTLANFAAGVMLLLFRPFRIGDFVEAGGSSGTVEMVGIFSTTLNTPDNIRITVPNSGVYGQTIKNYSANSNRRIDLVIGISYDDNIGTAIDTINKVLENEPRLLAEPAPTVAVAELADSSVNLVVRPWCKGSDYWSVRFDLTRELKEELEAAGCSIPYPQTDVHVHPIGGTPQAA
jgi:small conductance mechanosensitive channel